MEEADEACKNHKERHHYMIVDSSSPISSDALLCRSRFALSHLSWVKAEIEDLVTQAIH